MVAMAARWLGKALIILLSSDWEVVFVLDPLHLMRSLKVSVGVSCHENGHI